MAHNVLRASVTADTLTTEGGPATVLIDGADTPVTANGLQGYTPTPGDRLLVVVVGGVVEIVQWISRGTVPSVGGISTYRQSAAPSGTIDTGSVWWDDDGLEHRWDGAAWVAITAGTTAITPGAVDDSLVAQNGLNPAKGIVDMRPGTYTSLVHDWQLRDPTLNAQRFGSTPSIALKTIAEELTVAVDPTFTNVTQMGVAGAAPDAEYVAGPKTTLLNIVNDTHNFADYNVIPVQLSGGITAGDEVLHVDFNVGGRIGMASWAGIGTIYLNLDPATYNNYLVNGDGGVTSYGNGVNARTRLQWLDASKNVIYTQDGLSDTDPQSLSGGYYGHYGWLAINSNNFDPAVIGAGVTPTYIRLSVIWAGDTISTAETGGNYALECPGFSLWNIGGTTYQPGTNYIEMNHDLPSEEATLLSGLPVTPGDRYSLQARQEPWNTTDPYTGTYPPEGGYGKGDLILRVHLTGGGTSDHFVGNSGHGRQNDGWTLVTDTVTMPDDAETIDVVFSQTEASDGSRTYWTYPRLTIAGWRTTTWGQGAYIDDTFLQYTDANGSPTFKHDTTLGTVMQGSVAFCPQTILNSNEPTDASVAIWSSPGVGQWSSGYAGFPAQAGMCISPDYNLINDAPFSLEGGYPAGLGDARMAISAKINTDSGAVKAPVGFVGVAEGANPSTGATAQTTGFLFDSHTNTITPIGTLGAPSRIVGEVIMWPSPVLPSGWLKCDGSAVEGFTTNPTLREALVIEFNDNRVSPGFAAGTTTVEVGEGAAVDTLLQVGWEIASVSIGSGGSITTNVSKITAIDTVAHTVTFDGPGTQYGGPASFWVAPFGWSSFGIGFAYFNLPNFKDHFPMGAGGTRKLGDTGGAETHTLTTAEMPSHTHSSASHNHSSAAHTHSNGSLGVPFEYSANGTTGGSSTVVHDIDNLTGGGGTNVTGAVTGSTASTTPGDTGSTTPGPTGSAGSGSAHSILNPYEAITFIIYAGT